MKIAAATIPKLKEIFDCNPVNNPSCPVDRIPDTKEFRTLGDFLSRFLNIVFYIAVFLAFYYLIWGVFQYILAGGNKESLTKARSRITWALIGLTVVFAAYFITRFATEIFPPVRGGLSF